MTLLVYFCSIVMGGADRIPPGPKGRGPFTEEDKFKLPDGRVYVPGDAASDSLYGLFAFVGEDVCIVWPCFLCLKFHLHNIVTFVCFIFHM